MSTNTNTTSSPSQRGLLIVIEGLDRSGKSTQCSHLLSTLTSLGHKTILQKFPDRTTPTGSLINTYLTNPSSTYDDRAIHLLFSANRWEASSQILSLLSQGTTVIVDRYSFSGAVYSAAKNIPGLDLVWAWNMEVGLPMPDLVVFLDLEMEVARERGGWGEERYERVELQREVRRGFGEVFARLEGKGVRVEVVDAGVGGVEVVRGRVWDVVEKVLKEEGRGEIGVLPALGE